MSASQVSGGEPCRPCLCIAGGVCVGGSHVAHACASQVCVGGGAMLPMHVHMMHASQVSAENEGQTERRGSRRGGGAGRCM